VLLLFVRAFHTTKFKRNFSESSLTKARAVVTAASLTALSSAAPNISPQGVLVEQAVLCFADVLRKSYLEPRILSVKQFFVYLNGDRRSLFSFLTKRLVEDLRVFGDPSFLRQALLTLQSFSKSAPLADLVSTDEFLQSFSNRQIVFNFEGLDPAPLRKLLPLLHQIYTANLIAKARDWSEWLPFLSFFDTSFSDLADPGATFLLFRQLKGVFAAATVPNVSFGLTKWLIANHSDAVLSAVRAHSTDGAVVGAIVQLWSSVASRKKADFPGSSAVGIELFRASVALLDALWACAVDDHEWLSLKIICPSFEGRYANFGIMRLYGDASFDSMCARFFALLALWAPDPGRRLARLLRALLALLAIAPALVVGDAPHLSSAASALADALLAARADPWEPACACAAALIDAGAPAERLAPHFVLVVDGLINRPMERSNRQAAARFLFLMRNRAPEEVDRVMGTVVAAFEERYRDAVRDVARPAFGDLVVACDNEFQCRVEEFRNGMQRYRIQLASIAGFADVFIRREEVRPHF
jgi:hypothetical protein